MSIRLNGSAARLFIDLGAGRAIDPTTTDLLLAGWFKVSAFNSYDPFISFGINDPTGASPSRTGLEMYNNGSGTPRNFQGALDGSQLNFTTPIIAVDSWIYLAMYRPAGAVIFNGAMYCGDQTAMTGGGREHTGIPMSHGNPFRYITIGDLAQWGQVPSTFNGEVAQPRLWAGNLGAVDMADLANKLLAEALSASPIITSGIVFSLPLDNASDTRDQSGNGVTWTTTGTIANGAANPPSGSTSTLTAAAASIATAAGALTTQIVLGAAAAADVASSSAAVTTAIQLAMAALSNAAATGTLTSSIPLAADAAAVSTATAALNAGGVLQGAASDVAVATAALSTAIQLGGTAADAASASGALTQWATVTLAGALYSGHGALDPNFWVDSVPQLGTTLYYDPTHITIYPNGEISADTNNCTAVVQFFDGASWAFGLIIITSQMAAVAKDVASATAQLSTAIQLAAAANALATATAAFSAGAGLTAAAADTAAATGALSTKIPLSALAQDVSTAVGALTSQIKLAAAATDVATAGGALNGVISLNAAATAVSTALAGLSTGIQLGGSAQGAASAVGSLTASIKLSGAAADAANAIGALSTAITMSATGSSTASVTANLSMARALFAGAFDAANAVAVLSTGIKLDANAQAVSQASAALTTSTLMLADAAAQTTVTAALTDIVENPPVGVHAIDSRYVVSRSLVAGTRRTPRFQAKDAEETAILTFDLSDQLADSETLAGRITLQVACIAGTDANAASMLLGVPSYDAALKRVLQPLRGGVSDSMYYLKVAAATSVAPRVVTLAALLPVR